MACHQEFPKLQKLWSELQQEHGDEVAVLCVNKGDSPEVIQNLWSRKGFTMGAVGQAGTSVSDAFGVLGYPTLYVIGPEGTIRYSSSGYDPVALRKAISK